MSEFLTPDRGVLSAAQITELEVVGTAALERVETQYGSGFPHYSGGRDGGLAYHNRHHSWSVQQGTELMAAALELGRDERAIGRVAAAAHDIVQLKPRGTMEQESAEWLERQLDGKVPTELTQVGALAILGTEPTFTGNRLTGQMATELSYPNRSAELVAKSVACADLGELHSAQGPLLGHELFKEIRKVAPGSTPDMEGLIEFQRGQLWLVENYQYPLGEGELVFGALRGAVSEQAGRVLAQLEAGTITDWQELIARDVAFMEEHA